MGHDRFLGGRSVIRTLLSRGLRAETRPPGTRRSTKVGLSPGTLIHVGTRRTDAVWIDVTHFGTDGEFEERRVDDPADLQQYRDAGGVTWVDVNGVHDTELVGRIGKVFGLHPLLLEDVVNTQQRPKTEDYTDCVYLVVKMLRANDGDEIEVEQVSVVLGRNWVITFQEFEADVFDPIRRRLRDANTRVRNAGPDYLAYALVDAIVDHYFTLAEALGDRVEAAEDAVIADPDAAALEQIYALKRALVYFRRAVAPFRDAVSALQRLDSTLVQPATQLYLRDLHDHTIQVMDSLEMYREMVSNLIDVYMSSISNKMNDVMRVLTVIATVFIPLTFIVGVYGMNFDVMPELHWRWGYAAVWGVMGSVAIGLFIFFRRRNWL